MRNIKRTFESNVVYIFSWGELAFTLLPYKEGRSGRVWGRGSKKRERNKEGKGAICKQK